jgi:hypothetical protein
MANGDGAAVRRGEAWQPLRDHGGWMQMSEKAVFYALLERSDNGDCTIPAHMTPSLVQLASDTGGAKSTVVLALGHLERHGWVVRTRTGSKATGQTGRGHKTAYQLAAGGNCAPGCAWWKPEKGSDSRPVSAEKGSDSRTVKGSDELCVPAGQTPVSTKGYEGGGVKKGPEPELVIRDAAVNGHHDGPDWTLLRRLVRIVHNDPCGGLHRGELADKLGLAEHDPSLRKALMVAYRQRRIDFCRQYVVKPPPATEETA